MNTKLDVVRFECEDVIATSGGCKSVYGLSMYEPYDAHNSAGMWLVIKNGLVSDSEVVNLPYEDNTPLHMPVAPDKGNCYIYHCDADGNFVGYCDHISSFGTDDGLEDAFTAHGIDATALWK